MNTITYTIPNISCHHCVHTITMELSELPGVKSVNGEVETKKVTVTFLVSTSPFTDLTPGRSLNSMVIVWTQWWQLILGMV